MGNKIWENSLIAVVEESSLEAKPSVVLLVDA